MQTKTVKVSTSVKAEDNANGEARSLSHEFSYNEPTSLEEAVDAVGEEKALDLLTSEWRTRFSNNVRGRMREDLKGSTADDEIIADLEETFEGWTPATELGSRVSAEAAIQQKLSNMSLEEATAWLESQLAALQS